MAVADLLEELEHELEESPKVMFSSELAKVDTDKCLDILDEIREVLPVELERAAQLIQERDKIIGDAEMQAHNIIADAEKRAEELVSQDEIVARAEEEADRIIADAKKKGHEIRMAGCNFAKEIIADSENYIGGCLEDLRSARAKLDEMK
ncbi:MAG: hypothetical protein KIG36_04010 [Eubacteriales bacterium]|nr:hypothetical protein [Eubacteriales bacterium]